MTYICHDKYIKKKRINIYHWYIKIIDHVFVIDKYKKKLNCSFGPLSYYLVSLWSLN